MHHLGGYGDDHSGDRAEVAARGSVGVIEWADYTGDTDPHMKGECPAILRARIGLNGTHLAAEPQGGFLAKVSAKLP